MDGKPKRASNLLTDIDASTKNVSKEKVAYKKLMVIYP
jgi:hypothetical protein